jgi:hypothetical protein
MKNQKRWKGIRFYYDGYRIYNREWLWAADPILDDNEFKAYILMIH